MISRPFRQNVLLCIFWGRMVSFQKYASFNKHVQNFWKSKEVILALIRESDFFDKSRATQSHYRETFFNFWGRGSDRTPYRALDMSSIGKYPTFPPKNMSKLTQPMWYTELSLWFHHTIFKIWFSGLIFCVGWILHVILFLFMRLFSEDKVHIKI